LWFFDRFMNTEGTAVNEAVLLDPETIEWLAAQRDSGPTPPPIFGHTQQVNLFKTLIEATAGRSLFKRPVIPGLELRTQRKIAKTKSSVLAAQERNRKKKERP
jgi:hypothetical protein